MSTHQLLKIFSVTIIFQKKVFILMQKCGENREKKEQKSSLIIPLKVSLKDAVEVKCAQCALGFHCIFLSIKLLRNTVHSPFPLPLPHRKPE